MKQIKTTIPHHFKNIDDQNRNLVKCIGCNIEGTVDKSGTIIFKDDYNETLMKFCSNQNIRKVKIVSNALVSTFGLELNKEYDCQECPEELKHLYSKDVWIYSEQLEELVRCLPKEYLITQRENVINKLAPNIVLTH